MRREYWANLRTARKYPNKNNIHIRIAGEEKTLCSRPLNPEFDEDQAKFWKKIEKPNARRMCKQCKIISKRLGNGKDKVVKNSLKTISNRKEDEEDKLNPIEAELIKGEMTSSEEVIYDIKEVVIKAKQELQDMLAEMETCDQQRSLYLFVRIDAFKDFIKAGENVLNK